jgi:metallo-beta-lactamase family protein
VVRRTQEQNGKLIIPAFAVGRTQELVYALHQMMDKGEVRPMPVYVDSPLAVNISDVFRKHTDEFDSETQAFMAQDSQHAALGFDMLTYIRSVDESKSLNDRKDPMVIISASGMAETGRILHHLRNNIEDKRNTVLICSWQAPHTLGRRLAERAKQVRIFGEMFRRRCRVETIGGFSAHAGQNLLVEYAQTVQHQVDKVFLVHGESRGAEPLMERLRAGGLDRVYYPELHSTWEV